MSARSPFAAGMALTILGLVGAGCTTKPTALTLRNQQARPLTVVYRVAGGAQQVATLRPGGTMPVAGASRMADLADLRWGDPNGLNNFHDLPAAAERSSCQSGCVVTFDANRVRFSG